jgi:hypothetical protein
VIAAIESSVRIMAILPFANPRRQDNRRHVPDPMRSVVVIDLMIKVAEKNIL